jgi:hypothetical protein
MIADENIDDVVKDWGDGEGGRGGEAMISK